MFDTFLISFRLRMTYKVNSFLHGLKSLPLIRRLLPANIYDCQGLKWVAVIAAFLGEFFGMFIGRLIYFALIFLAPLGLLEFDEPAAGFLHLLVFLTIIGMIINNPLFDPIQDKYYAMFLLQMDARRYVVMDYGYYLSVHTPVLYYLLQPYNVGLESCSHAYSVVNAPTYAACYFLMDVELPTLAFGLCVIGFCVVYIAVALLLAYKLVPRTFKLRT